MRWSRWHIHQPHLSSKYFVRHDFHFRGFTVRGGLKDRRSHNFSLAWQAKNYMPLFNLLPRFLTYSVPEREDPGNEVSFSLPLPSILTLIAFSFAITNWSWNLLKTNSQTVWKHGDVLKNWDFFRFLHRHAHFQWQPPVNCLNAVSCFSASLSDYQINSSVSLFTAVTRKSGPTKSKFWTLRSYFIISPVYIISWPGSSQILCLHYLVVVRIFVLSST